MKYNTVQLEVILKVKIHWINPPKNTQEEIEREQVQCMIDVDVAKIAEGLEERLFDAMERLGAIKEDLL